MAFRFGEPGGRMYTLAGTAGVNILANWTTAINGRIVDWAVSAGNGRTSGSSLRCTCSNQQNALEKTLASSQQTLGVAFAFRQNSSLPSATTIILALYDGGSSQVDLRLRVDGTLQVLRNSGGASLGITSFALNAGAYYHIELKVKVDSSAGTVELRVNGATVLGPLTAQNTQSSGNASANAIRLGSNDGNGASDSRSYDFDDVIVWDSVATDAAGNSDIHDFVGDCGLAWLLPSGAGTTTQFTPDSGSNYARVNEATPDGDTSYVEDATVGHIDTYALADLGGSVGSIKSLMVVNYAKKTDVGSRGMKAELRTGGTNYAFASEIALGNTYLYYQSAWGSNPGTTSAWTVADVNALESGQQVSS